MKKFLAIFLILGSTMATSAQAECYPLYKKFQTKTLSRSVISGAAGAGAVSLGAATMYFGSTAGVMSTPGGFMVMGLVSGGVSTAAGVILTVSSVKEAMRFVSLFKALRLLKEAEAGTGDNLEELAEDLNEKYQLEGDDELSSWDLSEVINVGNESFDFCQDSKNLYGYQDIIDYLEVELGLQEGKGTSTLF